MVSKCPKGDILAPGIVSRVLLKEPLTSSSQVVKNLPANTGDVREAGSIPDQEDPLEEGMATHSSILSWRIPWTREAWQATVHEVTKSQTHLSD